MNFGVFAGRIGRNVDTHTTKDGQQVAHFPLAVDLRQDGTKTTLWIDCTLWGERVTKLAEYLTRGKSVTVAGDVGIRQFTKKDGTAAASIKLNVQRVTLQGAGAERAACSPSTPSSSDAPAKPASAPLEDFDDSIPF